MKPSEPGSGAAAGAAHEHPWYLAHHFDNIETQNHAVRLAPSSSAYPTAPRTSTYPPLPLKTQNTKS